MLDILFKVIESNKGPPVGVDDKLLYAESLAIKCFVHALSVLYLYRTTDIPDFPSAPLKFIDPASIFVLSRAAFEAFLTFHHVFIAPISIEDQNYRYWAYKGAGLIERQLFHPSKQEYQQKLAAEKKELGELHNKLDSNIIFQQLTVNQRARVLKGEWRFCPGKGKKISWYEMATDAGLAKAISSHIYKYLSGYAHSGSISVLQTKQSLQNKEQSQLTGSSMIVINVTAANLIHGYCKLFPLARNMLNIYPKGNDIVEEWIRVGQLLDIEQLK